MGRVFTNGPGDRGSIPSRVIPKTQKMVLNAALLSTQRNIPKSKRILCVSISITDSGSYIYHLSTGTNFNLWHNSKWITSPAQSFIPFCVILLHSLIWLIFFFNLCHYYYHIHPSELFILELADGLSLKFEWLPFFSGLQNFPEYSCRSLKCSGLNGLDYSAGF